MQTCSVFKVGGAWRIRSDQSPAFDPVDANMSFVRTVEFYGSSQPVPVQYIVGRLTSVCSFEPDSAIAGLKHLKIKRSAVLRTDIRALAESKTHTIELTKNVPGEMKYYTADDGDLVVTRRRMRLPSGVRGDDAGCDDQCFHEFLDDLACRHGLTGLDDFNAWRFVYSHFSYHSLPLTHWLVLRFFVHTIVFFCRNGQANTGRSRWTRCDLMRELHGPDACPLDPDDPELKRRPSVAGSL